MTIDNESIRKDYDPDGIDTVFAYDFRVDNASDLVVKEDDVVVVGGYTVSGLGNPTGGDVTFDVAPLASVDVLTLIRDVPLSQETAYPALGPFPAESHEAALDKLTMIAQQLQYQLSLQGVSWLPTPVAGKRLMWNVEETALINVDSEDEEAAYYAGVAEGYADDAAASASSADLSDGNANAAAVLAADSAAAAAISAANAALYDPLWGAWVNCTIAANFSNGYAQNPLQYRLSNDGSQLQVQGSFFNDSILAINSITLAFSIPIELLNFYEVARVPISWETAPIGPKGNCILFSVGDTGAMKVSAIDTQIPITSEFYVSVTLGRR